MSEKGAYNRLLVFVDGSDSSNEGSSGDQNPTNITRFKSIVKEGSTVDAEGRSVTQNVLYYSTGDDKKHTIKFRMRTTKESTERKVKDISADIYDILESSKDEVYLYGFGRGAYIARAVAGVLHNIGVLKRSAMRNFDQVYDQAFNSYAAKKDKDSIGGVHSEGPVQIRMVGIFESLKSSDGSNHDLSFNASTQNLRHAMALNENRSQLPIDLIDTPIVGSMPGRSFIQAWFVGTHHDIGGGTQHDGLALYPLQWMIIESIKLGLVVEFEQSPEHPLFHGIENPLKLTFPQFAGEIPQLGSEKIEWQFPYTNGIQVSMFDLHSSHMAAPTSSKCTHEIRFDEDSTRRGDPREVFSYHNSLLGWHDTGPFGTVIHPSVYCITQRTPRMLEHARFKKIRDKLANFEQICLKDAPTPWMDGDELATSQAKAFRILVCGKTGVGKSTLINKVFGVEMTEESKSYDQGVHDIDKAFESPNHPGLLIHDSRGWQAGSDNELELIAKFLRYRAYQKDPAESLHVIWFCVDADVSRIEAADKRTFETIAQFSHHVPVFVIGTKKDKLMAFHKIKLLEQYMEQSNDYKESSRLANLEAERLSEEQFAELRTQLSQIKHYKADGYCCLSKDDEVGVRELLSQTLGMITDDRVRIFCVAAQVVDVDQKINSAITECMRLGTHAIRTSMVPLPLSGVVATPTVSRMICEHVLQCFGFPDAPPEAVEEIMKRVVLKHLTKFLAVSAAQFIAVSTVAVGVGVVTLGIGSILGLASCFLGAPTNARMLLKCACDMILILERSFRYDGQYVSTKQIEDAAVYYTTATTKTSEGKTILLQQNVHDAIDKLVPMKSMMVGFKFGALRTKVDEIVYTNRFDKITVDKKNASGSTNDLSKTVTELPGERHFPVELDSANEILELDSDPRGLPLAVELPADVPVKSQSKVAVDPRGSMASTVTTSTVTASSRTLSDTPLTESTSRFGFNNLSLSSSRASDDKSTGTSVERVKTDPGRWKRFSSKMNLRKNNSTS